MPRARPSGLQKLPSANCPSIQPLYVAVKEHVRPVRPAILTKPSVCAASSVVNGNPDFLQPGLQQDERHLPLS